MDFTLALRVLFRFLHIASITTLLGGLVFARYAAATFSDAIAARWKPIAIPSVAIALLSGLYNLLTKVNPPPGYHMWFGIKFLLALHVMSMAILVSRKGVNEAKRARQLTGAVYSGFAIVLISAWLRWMP